MWSSDTRLRREWRRQPNRIHILILLLLTLIGYEWLSAVSFPPTSTTLTSHTNSASSLYTKLIMLLPSITFLSSPASTFSFTSPTATYLFPIRGALGASQFPGLPLPVDTVQACCMWQTLLPRDKLIFTKDSDVYEYDFIAQEARYLYQTIELFSRPVGAGIVITQPNQPWGRFNASTYWSNGFPYWFAGQYYWKYKPPTATQTPSSPNTISDGWERGVDSPDGFITQNRQWSLFFVDDFVYRYDNKADSADTTESWPKLIKSYFGPDFPLGMDDVDYHPEREEWLIFLQANYSVWSPNRTELLPGYPRMIHNDAIDGGILGMNRTQCSGLMDLSSMIGFIEDKSPEIFLRLLPYAPNNTCEWLVQVPSPMLKSPVVGFSGLVWTFDRFDLGSGAMIEIEELLDRPNNLTESGYMYSAFTEKSAGNVREQGSYNAVQPNRTLTPKLIATYTQASPPTLSVLNQSSGSSSSDSMTIRIRFTTTTDIVPGTGFGLRFAVATPTLQRLQNLNGIFWFSSLGLVSPLTIQSIIIAPATQTPAGISFSLRFDLYPLLPEYIDLVNVTATSTLTGAIIHVCSNATLYARGYISPRCTFNTAPGDGPILLTYYAAPGFSSNVMGEYVTLTYCNNDPATPQIFSTLNGSIGDGSGIHYNYRIASDCSYLITGPSDVNDPNYGPLFIQFTFTSLELSATIDTGSNLGKHRVEFHNGPSMNDTLIHAVTADDMVALPSIVAVGSSMFLRFITGYEFPAQGWEGNWRMYYPPILNSLVLSGFQPITSDEIVMQLSTVLGSNATSIVYAGLTSATITLSAIDKHGTPIDWSFSDWLGAFYRWAPTSLKLDSPTVFEALTTYPLPLNTTNSSFWSARGVSVTDATIASITEMQATAGVLHFVAPTLTGDYTARVVVVLHSHGSVVTGWGAQSQFEPGSYSALASELLVHVATNVALPELSTAIRVPDSLLNSTLADPAFESLIHTLPTLSLNANGTGLNGPITAGSKFRFLVITRDQFGNIMEEFQPDDLRTFVSSRSLEVSPPIILETLGTGRYQFTVLPTIAASDYVLTVLVSGSDIFGGAHGFRPRVIPATLDVAHSSIIDLRSDLSLLGGSSLLPGTNIPILVTTRDRFGNDRAEFGANDSVTFSWPGHNVRLVSHGSGINASQWLYLADADSSYEVSAMTVLIGNSPIGYDPSVPSTAYLANGITVTVGSPVIVAYDTPQSIQIGLTVTAALCMACTVGLLFFLGRYHTVGLIRAASPNFLTLMLIGALFEYATIIPLTLPQVTKVSCALEVLLGHFGFFAIFGALYVKTSRVKSIFKEKRLNAQTSTDLELFGRLGVFAVVLMAYYALWMGLSPPQPTPVTINFTQFTACASQEYLFPTLILIVEGLSVLYGAYLSATIWSVPTTFNESKPLLIAIYNVAIVGGLLTILVKAVSIKPTTQILFTGIGIIFVTSVVLSSLFGPKVWAIYLMADPLHPEKVPNFTKPNELEQPTHRPPTDEQDVAGDAPPRLQQDNLVGDPMAGGDVVLQSPSINRPGVNGVAQFNHAHISIPASISQDVIEPRNSPYLQEHMLLHSQLPSNANDDVSEQKSPFIQTKRPLTTMQEGSNEKESSVRGGPINPPPTPIPTGLNPIVVRKGVLSANAPAASSTSHPSLRLTPLIIDHKKKASTTVGSSMLQHQQTPLSSTSTTGTGTTPSSSTNGSSERPLRLSQTDELLFMSSSGGSGGNGTVDPTSSAAPFSHTHPLPSAQAIRAGQSSTSSFTIPMVNQSSSRGVSSHLQSSPQSANLHEPTISHQLNQSAEAHPDSAILPPVPDLNGPNSTHPVLPNASSVTVHHGHLPGQVEPSFSTPIPHSE